MTPILVALLAILLTLIAYVVHQAKKVNRFWKEKGVPHEKPLIFVGNSLRTLLIRTSQGERIKEVCQQFPDEPLVGFMDFRVPIYIIKDAALAERVLIKDFTHFADRGSPPPETNPLEVNLFTMTGKRWRAVRNKFSPIFTTGKLRNMFDLITPIAKSMHCVIESEPLIGLELKEILGRFTMDVIGSFAFGFDAGNLTNENSEFHKMGREVFNIDTKMFLKILFMTNFPKLSRLLGFSFSRPEIQKYFIGIIKEAIQFRMDNNIQRNDFVDLMLQLKDKGYVEIHTKDPNDDYLKTDTESYVTDTFEMTDDLLIGQAFVFLTAGFEGITSIMTYCCYEISKNPDIQEKLRNEVKAQVKEQSGQLNFNAIKEMAYLDMCIKETLRKYPPPQGIFRRCTKDYTFPSGVKINYSQRLIVSVLSIHHDPKYYPDPMIFNPERFAPDTHHEPCAYLPFGEGPRTCIAMRFALIQIKFGIAKLLMHYKMKVNSKTVEPLTFCKTNLVSTPQNPVYFDLERISE